MLSLLYDEEQDETRREISGLLYTYLRCSRTQALKSEVKIGSIGWPVALEFKIWNGHAPESLKNAHHAPPVSRTGYHAWLPD